MKGQFLTTFELPVGVLFFEHNRIKQVLNIIGAINLKHALNYRRTELLQ